MINVLTDLALSDPFASYASYLPELKQNDFPWLSSTEKRRLMRYGLLFAIYHNFVSAFLDGKAPRYGDKKPIETSREYGDASLIVDTIRDATIAGEVVLSDFVPEELWQVWNTSRLDKLVTDHELVTGIAGDGFYHQYQRGVQDWRAEAIDPRYSVVQAFDRELRHIVFWSQEKSKDNTYVTALEYVLVENDSGAYECWWRQVRWRVKQGDEIKQEDKNAAFPFNYKMLTAPVDLLGMRGASPEQAEELSPVFMPEELAGTGAAPFYPFTGEGSTPLDFMPVIHISNIESGGVYGLSDLHGSLQTLIDIVETNGHLRDAEDLLGIPPVAIENAKEGYSDLKHGFSAGPKGQQEEGLVRLKPGLLLNGKVYLLDVSKLLTALLEGKKHKAENIFSVSHVPEIAASPSSMRVVSGEALKVMFRPLVLLVERKRIDRRAQFTKMMQNFAKLLGTELTLSREQPTVISFGDVEQWLTARFGDQILLSSEAQVVSKGEARANLVRAGVVDKGTLDPNYTPPEQGSTLTFNESVGQGNSNANPNEEGTQNDDA